ncbi:MAG: PD-(D/E)XK nuclease family protein [Prevotellaceae bacterium]|nr:PD-(D/E)XK nuclease family protein [Prevotellaceae bacterium]
MQSLLHKVNQLVQEEKILKREKERRGENFNIFEVMHAQRDEVYTHSAIIASLLDPMWNHGCKSTFLKVFVDLLKESLPNVDFSFDTDLEKCHVYVEYNIGNISSGNESGGRIDIIIQSEKRDKAIIIENKIYADDQKKQLYRYKNYAQTHYKSYIILYLTLDGHVPSNDSTSGDMFSMEEGKDFFCIDYKSFIRDWLICCKEKAASSPVVRETITQYYNLILKLTNQDMESSTKEKLVDLLANKDNIAAMFKIKSVHYDVLNKICNTTLKGHVQKIANELEMECICSTTDWCKRWNGHFFFYKPEWKFFCIGFEFMGNDLTNFNYGIRYKGELEKGKAPDVKQEILRKLGGKHNEWWASHKPFKDQDWNNDVVFEHLYDGTIKTEITNNVKELCKELEGIGL